MQAIMVQCIVDESLHYNHCVENIPTWALNLHVFQKENFHVMKCEFGGKQNCLFGVFTFHHSRKIQLHVPSQYLPKDLDFGHCQWESFVFQCPQWKTANKASVRCLLSLMGKCVFQIKDNVPCYGKVISYNRTSKEWLVEFRDKTKQCLLWDKLNKLLR